MESEVSPTVREEDSEEVLMSQESNQSHQPVRRRRCPLTSQEITTASSLLAAGHGARQLVRALGISYRTASKLITEYQRGAASNRLRPGCMFVASSHSGSRVGQDEAWKEEKG